MHLRCDYDGKFLFVGDAFIKAFSIDKNFFLTKRIFNLIHPDYVIDFINVYNSFLNQNISKKMEKKVFCVLNDSVIACTLLLVKSKLFIDIFIVENKSVDLNLTTSLLSKIKQFFFLTRIKYTIGSLMPFFFAVFWAFYKYKIISYSLVFLSFLCLLCLHIIANTFNDYFDWKSKRDIYNLDYVLLSTGGSRAIDFNIISERKMYMLSIGLSIFVLIIGLYIIFLKGLLLLFIGLIALFSVYFYSAPPIHLASRFGVGELMHIVCLGPLIIYSTVYVISNSYDIFNFILGLPHGFLITGCLLINEYPDSRFDRLSGKNNLAVILGSKYIPYVYMLLVCASFLILFILIYFSIVPFFLWLVFIIAPYAFLIVRFIFKTFHSDKIDVTNSCIKSLNIYVYYSILLIVSIVISIYFN